MTIVSVQPLYNCNCNCSFCYLGDLREDRTVLNIETLEDKLRDIKFQTRIEQIDIFGGEVSLLSETYLEALILTCARFSNQLTITSNLQNFKILDKIKKWQRSGINIVLATSWNPERPDNKRIENLLTSGMKFPQDSSILTVILPEIIKNGSTWLLQRLQTFNLPVTLLRYFPSIKNSYYNLTSKDFEEFMIQVGRDYLTNNYTFSLNNFEYFEEFINPMLGSNIFIMPNGNLAWIKYNGLNEYFYETDKIENWKLEQTSEELQYYMYCSTCKYYKRCLAEHLNFNDIGEHCCGLKNLLDWWYNEGKGLKEKRDVVRNN